MLPASTTSRQGVGRSAFPILLLSVMLVAFGNGGMLFYAFWVSAGIVVALYILTALSKLTVRKDVVVTIACQGVWLVYALVASFNAEHLTMHLKMILLTAFYIVAASAAVSVLMKDIESFYRALCWVTLTWVLANTVALVVYLLGYSDYEGRAFSGLYFNRNTLAVVGCFVFAFWLILDQVTGLQGRWRSARRWVLFLTAMLVLVSASTKGLLGLALVTALFIKLRHRGLKTVAYTASVLVVVGAVALFTPAGERLHDKAMSLQGIGKGLERIALIEEAVDVIAEHPLAGVGVHNSQFFLLTERHFLLLSRGELDEPSVGAYSHVNYLEMILNAGWPGFLLYYVPILALLAKVIRSRPWSRDATTVRHLLLILLTLKLVFDLAMVSYYELSHVLVLSVAFLAQQRFLNVRTVGRSWKGRAGMPSGFGTAAIAFNHPGARR